MSRLSPLAWRFSIDAAVKPRLNFGAVGVVLRLPNDSLVSAIGKVVHHIVDPLTLEFMAIRLALLAVRNFPTNNVIIFSDSTEAVLLLNCEVDDIHVG